MKKLNILLSVVLVLFICSCGGNQKKKEDTNQEAKKETKKLSKSTKEGMMALLDASGIDVPSELKFEEVEKKSSNYFIRFKNDSVTTEVREKLDQWYVGKINEMEEEGWKKQAVRENEEMMGMIMNEFILYPPENKDIDVSYGLTLYSRYDKEDMSYKFSVSAN